MNKIRIFSNKRGIAIITVLGIAFVLLALASVLMLNSLSHMGISQKYYYETQALNIAEGGVSYAIHKLENFSRLDDIPSQTSFTDSIGDSSFKAEVYNNIENDEYDDDLGGYFLPPHSILIVSEGTITAGTKKYKKIVETIVNYQLIPNTVSCEGTMKLNIGTGEPLAPGELYPSYDPGDPPATDLHSFDTIITSIDGFTGNIHSNYTDISRPTYRCTLEASRYVNLYADGATFSSCGDVGTEATDKIEHHGGTALSNAPEKNILDMDYGKLVSKANSESSLISMGEEVPGIAEFLGKMKRDGDKLMAYVDIPLWGEDWVNTAKFGGCLPDGMHWESSTGTLVITKNNNYTWNGDLQLSGVNIRSDAPNGAGIYINGSLSNSDAEMSGDNLVMVAKNDIYLSNFSLNITSTDENTGVAIFCKNFTLSTKSYSVPPGGNQFKGIAYVKDGKIDITNNYTGAIDNDLTLEGLVINATSDGVDPDSTGLKVKNKGGDNFNLNLKYNPYVASPMIDYQGGAVHLQPVYWKID